MFSSWLYCASGTAMSCLTIYPCLWFCFSRFFSVLLLRGFGGVSGRCTSPKAGLRVIQPRFTLHRLCKHEGAAGKCSVFAQLKRPFRAANGGLRSSAAYVSARQGDMCGAGRPTDRPWVIRRPTALVTGDAPPSTPPSPIRLLLMCSIYVPAVLGLSCCVVPHPKPV